MRPPQIKLHLDSWRRWSVVVVVCFGVWTLSRDECEGSQSELFSCGCGWREKRDRKREAVTERDAVWLKLQKCFVLVSTVKDRRTSFHGNVLSRSPAACCEPFLPDLNIWEESAEVYLSSWSHLAALVKQPAGLKRANRTFSFKQQLPAVGDGRGFDCRLRGRKWGWILLWFVWLLKLVFPPFLDCQKTAVTLCMAACLWLWRQCVDVCCDQSAGSGGSGSGLLCRWTKPHLHSGPQLVLLITSH